MTLTAAARQGNSVAEEYQPTLLQQQTPGSAPDHTTHNYSK